MRNTRFLRAVLANLDAPEVELCHNLRPTAADGSLTPVAAPTPVIDDPIPGAHILPGGRISAPDGEKWLFVEQDGLLVGSNGRIYLIFDQFPGIPTGIITVGERHLVMMGDDASPLWLDHNVDAIWKLTPADSLPEPLAVTRTDSATVSTEVGGIDLSGVYNSRSTHLTETDVAKVTRLMTDAYESLALGAARRSLYIQPVIARYRLIGYDERPLYLSAPVLIAPDSGRQFTAVGFTLTGANFSTLSTETVTVDAFGLQLRPCERLTDGWGRVVKRVELLVSPQLHPLRPDLLADYRFGSFSATAGELRATTPGVSIAESQTVAAAADGSHLRCQVESILACIDDTDTLAHAGTACFSSSADSGLTASVQPLIPSLTDEIAALEKIILRSRHLPAVSPTDAILAALTPPNCLCSRLADVGGDCIALAGVAAKRFDGHLPSEYTTVTDDHTAATSAATPVAARVTFADGSSCVRSATLTGFTLSALSPLLTYPSASAVRLELYCDNRSLRVDLRPDPSGRYAYWLSDDCRPVTMTVDKPSFILPAASPRQLRYPGTVVVSSVADPLRPLAVTEIADRSPVVVRAAPGNVGGWDSGSARFYVFGSGGVRSLSVNSARTRLTARTLDRRPVGSSTAVCDISDGSTAVIAGGDLLGLTAQKVVTLRPDIGAEHLGWNPLRQELICFHTADCISPDEYILADSDTLTRLYPSATVVDRLGRRLYTRSCPTPSSLLSAPDGLWIVDSAGRLLDFTAEQPTGTVEVAYRSKFPTLAASRAARRRFVIPISGNVDGGRVEIRSDNGGGISHSDLVAAIDLRGEIIRLPPLAVNTSSRPNHYLNLRLTVRPSFKIS